MELKHKGFDEVCTYYIKQIHKSLYLFEENDEFGWKHAYKILRDVEKLIDIYPSINKQAHIRLVINLYNMYEELHALDQNMHQYVKNLYFDSESLFMKLKEDHNAV